MDNAHHFAFSCSHSDYQEQLTMCCWLHYVSKRSVGVLCFSISERGYQAKLRSLEWALKFSQNVGLPKEWEFRLKDVHGGEKMCEDMRRSWSPPNSVC